MKEKQNKVNGGHAVREPPWWGGGREEENKGVAGVGYFYNFVSAVNWVCK